MRFLPTFVLLILLSESAIAIAPAVLAEENDLSIVGLDAGRRYYDSWWSINAFARTSYVEFNVSVQNRLAAALDAKLISSVHDEVDYPIAYVESLVTLLPNSTISVVFGPVKIEDWARIGAATAHVNVRVLHATAWCPEASISFRILPPVRYYLTVESYLTTQEPYNDGRIWIDGLLYTMPMTLNLLNGAHVIKVSSRFYDYRVHGLFLMLFKSWETGSTDNFRLIALSGNCTISPVFAAVRQHLQPL